MSDAVITHEVRLTQEAIDALLGKPDWLFWRKVETAGLPAAILLSLNIEPRTWKDLVHNIPDKRIKGAASDGRGIVETLLEKMADESLSKRYSGRLTMAENHFPGALDQSRGAIVSLSEFADWLVSKRLSMPTELADMASVSVPEDLLLATDSEPEEALQPKPLQAPGPCVTKSGLKKGLDLVGTTWNERLRIPRKGIDHYKPARLAPGRQGRKAGSESTWNPVIFTRIAVEQGHMNKGRAIALFSNAWPEWQDELEAEMGEL